MVGEWFMDWSERVEEYLSEPIFNIRFSKEDKDAERFRSFWSGVQLSIKFPLIGGKTEYLLRHHQFSPWSHLAFEIATMFPDGGERAPKENIKIREDGVIEVDGKFFCKCAVGGKSVKTEDGRIIYWQNGDCGYTDVYWRLPWALYQLMKVEFEDAKRVFSDRVFMKIREAEVKRIWRGELTDSSMVFHMGVTKPFSDCSNIDFNPSHADQEAWYVAVMIYYLCENIVRAELWGNHNNYNVSMLTAHRLVLEKFYPSSPKELMLCVEKWWHNDMHKARKEIMDMWERR